MTIKNVKPSQTQKNFNFYIHFTGIKLKFVSYKKKKNFTSLSIHRFIHNLADVHLRFICKIGKVGSYHLFVVFVSMPQFEILWVLRNNGFQQQEGSITTATCENSSAK